MAKRGRSKKAPRTAHAGGRSTNSGSTGPVTTSAWVSACTRSSSASHRTSGDLVVVDERDEVRVPRRAPPRPLGSEPGRSPAPARPRTEAGTGRKLKPWSPLPPLSRPSSLSTITTSTCAPWGTSRAAIPWRRARSPAGRWKVSAQIATCINPPPSMARCGVAGEPGDQRGDLHARSARARADGNGQPAAPDDRFAPVRGDRSRQRNRLRRR